LTANNVFQTLLYSWKKNRSCVVSVSYGHLDRIKRLARLDRGEPYFCGTNRNRKRNVCHSTGTLTRSGRTASLADRLQGVFSLYTNLTEREDQPALSVLFLLAAALQRFRYMHVIQHFFNTYMSKVLAGI
jgi:hypothetical protein